jgi:glycosyltransferase involved in cell wall biosynthesis
MSVRVRIFSTVRTEGRTSSEVYANELVSALRRLDAADVSAEVVSVSGWAGRIVKRPRSLHRVAVLIDRYLLYQSFAAARRGGIAHIADHGYGHLAFSLEPHRTVCTFYDGLLFRIDRGDFPALKGSRLTLLGHRLSLAAIRRCRGVIAVSEAARRDFVELAGGREEAVRVIPLGVSTEFNPREREASGERWRRPVILHVGHNEFYKNVECLIRTIPWLGRKLGQSPTLLKVGTGFSPDQWQLVRDLGLADQVVQRTGVSRNELVDLYNQADVLVMPSLYEGFGLPVLEAMACGLPVVASRRGALAEVAGGAAVMVEPEVEELQEAMLRVLLDSGLRAQLTASGLQRAAQFTWDRTARMTADLYKEIA